MTKKKMNNEQILKDLAWLENRREKAKTPYWEARYQFLYDQLIDKYYFRIGADPGESRNTKNNRQYNVWSAEQMLRVYRDYEDITDPDLL